MENVKNKVEQGAFIRKEPFAQSTKDTLAQTVSHLTRRRSPSI